MSKKPAPFDLHDLAFVVGLALVVVGVSSWSRPAGLVVAGVAFILLALIAASTKRG